MGRTSNTAPKTYRERQLERAARLREWADSRERKAEAAYARARGIGDSMPFGQPVLAGHHSAGRHRRDLERMQSAMDQVVEHTRKAEEMRRRADSIEAAANRAIYSDDEDALERLREKLADLEAQRDRIKAYNATARKGNPDPSLLDDKQRAELETSLRVTPYFCKDGQFPAYVLKNLASNIRRIRQRIEELEAPPVKRLPRWMEARFGSDCAECGKAIEKGDRIAYYKATRQAFCEPCGETVEVIA